MYGVSQSVIDMKQKTVASYFPTPQRTESLRMKARPFSIAQAPQQKLQPTPAPRKISLQVKPMMTTSMHRSQFQAMNSLSRSKTMPSLANVELLDESNIDDAFDELLSSVNL
jgi:hypothetical protein